MIWRTELNQIIMMIPYFTLKKTHVWIRVKFLLSLYFLITREVLHQHDSSASQNYKRLSVGNYVDSMSSVSLYMLSVTIFLTLHLLLFVAIGD